ncbi:MAG: hypothetical protein ACKO8I_11040 [Cyanobacteriota bacterium]
MPRTTAAVAGSVSFAPLSMAISTAPRCENRGRAMHVYADGIKSCDHELARKLQGRFGTTGSVI